MPFDLMPSSRMRPTCLIMTAFISERIDWAADRPEMLAFWRSGKTEADVLPDALPWLYVGSSADTLPWAARHLD